MEESEFFICRHCGKEHEALTQETASYLCPKLRKSKDSHKMLDSVSLKNLTNFNNSSETQDPNTKQSTGDQYATGSKEKAKQTPDPDRDTRSLDNKDDNPSTGGKPEHERL